MTQTPCALCQAVQYDDIYGVKTEKRLLPSSVCYGFLQAANLHEVMPTTLRRVNVTQNGEGLQTQNDKYSVWF